MKDVAARARVSLGTVSNVLSGANAVSAELRARVEKAIDELGYLPNEFGRSLKTQRSRMLGMVVSDIANPFFAEMVRGAEDAAVEKGYVLVTFNTNDRPGREEMVFDLLRSRRFDGLLAVVALQKRKHPHLEAARQDGLPVVFLDRVPPDFPADAVVVDNEDGVRQSIEYLIASGHKRIGYLGGRQTLYIAKERLQGYRQAMKKADLPEIIREGDFREEAGYEQALELLQSPEPPTALFTANMRIAIGALRAIGELGLAVPQQIALATFDYVEWLDAFHPKLTCVVQPAYEMGKKATALLLDRIEGKGTEEPVTLRLPVTLRVAESTNGREH